MQALTLEQAQNMAIQLMDQYSVAGNLVAQTYNNQKDYLLRVPLLVNDAQNYIATTAKKIPAELRITQAVLPNELSGDTYSIKPYFAEPIVYEAQQGRAYYFEADRPGQVLIMSDGASRLESFAPQGGGFAAFKGFFAPDHSAGPVSLRFLGETPYVLRNVCVYRFEFPSVDEIPAYGRFQKYKMPDDFFQLDGSGIPHYAADGRFVKSHQYGWQGEDTLLLASELSGEWVVQYYRYPRPIRQDSPLAATLLDNTPEAQMCVPYYVASHLIMQDNPYIGQVLMNEFETKLSRLGESVQAEFNPIEDAYGGLNGSWY